MILCSNCLKEIKYPKYFVNQLGFLCPDCSKEHSREEIKKLQCEINKLQKQISNINQKVRENIQANCEHNYKDTRYAIMETDGELKTLCRCSEYDHIKYKDF